MEYYNRLNEILASTLEDKNRSMEVNSLKETAKLAKIIIENPRKHLDSHLSRKPFEIRKNLTELAAFIHISADKNFSHDCMSPLQNIRS